MCICVTCEPEMLFLTRCMDMGALIPDDAAKQLLRSSLWPQEANKVALIVLLRLHLKRLIMDPQKPLHCEMSPRPWPLSLSNG